MKNRITAMTTNEQSINKIKNNDNININIKYYYVIIINVIILSFLYLFYWGLLEVINIININIQQKT